MSFRKFLKLLTQNNKVLFTPKRLALLLLGTAILSFGICNIHRQTSLTEGGVLGLILLLNHWIGLSPSILSPMLDLICYAVAFRFLGFDFLKVSLVATVGLAGFFRLWEAFPPFLPDLTAYPLAAALLGGISVGVGVGLVVRQGGSCGGDDALALAISKVTKLRLYFSYLATDLTVLLLSLTYIPPLRIGISLASVMLSSLLIDWIADIGKPRQKHFFGPRPKPAPSSGLSEGEQRTGQRIRTRNAWQ